MIKERGHGDLRAHSGRRDRGQGVLGWQKREVRVAQHGQWVRIRVTRVTQISREKISR